MKMTSRFLARTVGVNAVILGILAVSQIVFEYTLAAVTDVQDYEAYVAYRNIILFVSGIAPLGLLNIVVRLGYRETARAYLFTALALASSFVFTLGLFGVLSGEYAWDVQSPFGASALAFLFCITFTLSNLFRSKMHFKSALIIRDGWRLWLWIAFPLMVIYDSYSEAVIGVLTVSIIAVVFVAVGWWMGSVGGTDVILNDIVIGGIPSKDRRLMWAFSLSAISLAVISYADQLVLDMISVSSGELKQYSLSVTFIVSPLVLLANATGQVLMPLFVNGKIGIMSMRRKLYNLILLVVAGCVVCVVGYNVLREMMEYVNVVLDLSLYLVLVGLGVIRVIYAVPSAYIGGLGSARFINGLTGLGIMYAVMHVVLIVVLYRSIGVLGVAVATMLHWAAKTITYCVMAWYAIRRAQVGTA